MAIITSCPMATSFSLGYMLLLYSFVHVHSICKTDSGRIPISVGLSICGVILNSISQFIQRKMVLTSDCISLNTVSKAWAIGLFRMKYGNQMG